jgi:hypothetical protein
MPSWLFDYIVEELGPRLQEKKGRSLAPPVEYTTGDFWTRPPDPVFSLAHHCFDKKKLFFPLIFLWLPHFLVSELLCPNCNNELEKNGIAAPRRIVDIDSTFWMLTWRYRCKQCSKGFQGWSNLLLETLPHYVQQSFPAVLSYRNGISNRLAKVLRACYQHKMGATGVEALLYELHTSRFDMLCTQYLEAALEKELLRRADLGSDENLATRNSQTTLDTAFVYRPPQLESLGSFWDAEGYSGFVPSRKYLTTMYNKLVDVATPSADQHTSLLPIDQICIDDSHKVRIINFSPIKFSNVFSIGSEASGSIG